MTTVYDLSIIIPTYDRAHLLSRAVNSALLQTVENIEVIVVDDASPTLIELPPHPRLRIVRLPKNRGGAAARNVGAQQARGRWITYLDDDDELLPDMAEVSLKALSAPSSLPLPIAVISGIEVVDVVGKVIQTRVPPTLPRGAHFFLEDIESDQSFNSKQTMVVERDVLLSIGGFDESFKSRVHSELFLRLNATCSILGLPTITYRLTSHEGPRVSRNPALRQVSFRQLIDKHQDVFKQHPQTYADFILNHVRMSQKLGQSRVALLNLFWAFKVHPLHVLGEIGSEFVHRSKAMFQTKLLNIFQSSPEASN